MQGNRHDPAEATDRDLVIAYQSGDHDAYDEIYRRHIGRVRKVCRRFLNDPQDAEEAAQETFLRSFKALGRFNGQYQVGAWLARIATNVCVDQLRASQRHIRLVDLDENGIEEIEDGASPDASVPDRMELASTLKSIRPLHARALMLRTVEGLSHQEMAGELEMTADQVKALLHRARISFRRAWQNASGWAIAPLASMRSLLTQRSRETAVAGDSTAAGLTSPAAHVLFEKVAASAVAAALAFSGTPTVPQSKAPLERESRTNSVVERSTEIRGDLGSEGSATALSTESSEKEQDATSTEPRKRLARAILSAPAGISQAFQDEPEEEEPRDEPDSNEPTTGPTVTAKPAKDKVAEARERIDNTFPDLR